MNEKQFRRVNKLMFTVLTVISVISVFGCIASLFMGETMPAFVIPFVLTIINYIIVLMLYMMKKSTIFMYYSIVYCTFVYELEAFFVSYYRLCSA